jgi:hypothetical protein
MFIFLNEYRFVPPLKNVVHARMSAVEALRVYSVQLPHSKTEVWIRCFDDDVIVVVHEAVSMTQPMVFFHYGSENIQKNASICILQENFSPGIYLERLYGISLLDILF